MLHISEVALRKTPTINPGAAIHPTSKIPHNPEEEEKKNKE
jgi:hypothetical protein